jgi:ABC-2 type transport system permease protein
MDFMVIEFYTLIAMTCLFGAMMTTSVISNYLANISKRGARLTLAPVNRLTLLLGGLLATFIVQVFAVGIILFYTNVILGIDYGDRFDLIVLLSFVGCLAGNCLGLVAGSMTFKSENTRQGIVMAVTMLGCFFSGMMGVTMKYVIDKNIPFINIVNPASMITDGFYSLYYYETLNRFYFDIMSLIIFSSILLIISYFLMRRKKYDSI